MMERQVIGILVLGLYDNAKRYADDLEVLFLYVAGTWET